MERRGLLGLIQEIKDKFSKELPNSNFITVRRYENGKPTETYELVDLSIPENAKKFRESLQRQPYDDGYDF